MLRACHRVLDRGGVIGFAVIALASDMHGADVEMATEAGPPYPDAGVGYEAMMKEIGFVDVETVDVGDEFLDTTRAWVRESDAEAEAMQEVVGIEEFVERQSRRRLAASAIERGLLKRFLLTGRRP